MSAAIAWIIPLPGNVRVALGYLEFVHVLPDVPARSAIADGPVFLNEAVSWDGGIIPVFDAGKFSQGIEKTSPTTYYGIVRYRANPASPQQFGALKMTDIPQRTAVEDHMACDLPDSHAHWRPYCVSCFKLHGHTVPVLDLARLFSLTPLQSGGVARAGAAGNDSGDGSGPRGSDPSDYTDSLATT